MTTWRFKVTVALKHVKMSIVLPYQTPQTNQESRGAAHDYCCSIEATVSSFIIFWVKLSATSAGKAIALKLNLKVGCLCFGSMLR